MGWRRSSSPSSSTGQDMLRACAPIIADKRLLRVPPGAPRPCTLLSLPASDAPRCSKGETFRVGTGRRQGERVWHDRRLAGPSARWRPPPWSAHPGYRRCPCRSHLRQRRPTRLLPPRPLARCPLRPAPQANGTRKSNASNVGTGPCSEGNPRLGQPLHATDWASGETDTCDAAPGSGLDRNWQARSRMTWRPRQLARLPQATAVTTKARCRATHKDGTTGSESGSTRALS